MNWTAARPSGRLAARPVARPVSGPRPALPPAVVWIPAGLVAAGMLLPLIYLLIRAAQAGPDLWSLLLRPRTFDLLLRSAGLTAAVTLTAIAIAVPLAWLTVRTDLLGRRVWAVLASLPLVIPTYVGGFALIAALGPRGLLQQALAGPFGVDRLPAIYGFPGAWLALTLFTFPYVLLTVRAALRGLDPALEEAARGLGHGGWSTFRRVTLPHLRPAITSGSLLVALYTLSDFGVVSLLQFETFTQAIYTQYQGSLDRTLAAGFALLLVGLTALVLWGEAGTRGRARYHRSTVGAVRRQAPRPLGRWRVLALAFAGLVIAVSLLLPAGVLIYWIARGVFFGARLQPIWQATGNSLLASGLAAIGAVVAALPIAILVVRYGGRSAALIEKATYAGFALPGIVIALALVFFATRVVTPLYQTLALLVAAYVIRFLPQAIGGVRSSLLQVNPRLEEAARGLGRTPAKAIWDVTVPLIRPGVVAGAALVFLTSMKELPATLLLAPIGYRTLATSIWTSTAEGAFAEAAIASLILILTSAVPLALLTVDRGGLGGD
ncbi:MAG TPA: iron ABC transporter permease [Dehalococcoidia bacterium]|nr:iron ABC transporter permease [Dehalococcoidia bacterium]